MAEIKKLTAVLVIVILIACCLGGALVVEINTNLKLNEEIILLKNDVDSLKSDRNNYTNQIDNLYTSIDNLNVNITSLVNVKSLLENEKERLLSQNSNLSGEISSLNCQITSLDSQIFYLNTTIDQLYQDVASLITRLDSANTTITALNFEVIKSKNDYLNICTCLNASNATIITLYSQLNSTQAQVNSLLTENNAWWHIYWVRVGAYPEELVTPFDPTIISLSHAILGANANGVLTWSDMDTINSWVYNNIIYSYDPIITNPNDSVGYQEYWQSPNETLIRGEGDCDDFTHLALSLMLAEQNVGWLWATTVLFDDGSGHAAIFVNVANDTMFVYDPTWGWHSSTNIDEPSALSEWALASGSPSITNVIHVFEIHTNSYIYTFNNILEFYIFF